MTDRPSAPATLHHTRMARTAVVMFFVVVLAAGVIRRQPVLALSSASLLVVAWVMSWKISLAGETLEAAAFIAGRRSVPVDSVLLREGAFGLGVKVVSRTAPLILWFAVPMTSGSSDLLLSALQERSGSNLRWLRMPKRARWAIRAIFTTLVIVIAAAFVFGVIREIAA